MPALATMVAIAGCGGASTGYQVREESAQPDRQESAELQQEQQRVFDEELETVAAEADCAAICEVVGRICELGDRICAIADRHPTDRELSGRCQDSRARCDRAAERGAQNCSSAEEGDSLRCPSP